MTRGVDVVWCNTFHTFQNVPSVGKLGLVVWVCVLCENRLGLEMRPYSRLVHQAIKKQPLFCCYILQMIFLFLLCITHISDFLLSTLLVCSSYALNCCRCYCLRGWGDWPPHHPDGVQHSYNSIVFHRPCQKHIKSFSVIDCNWLIT